MTERPGKKAGKAGAPRAADDVEIYSDGACKGNPGAGGYGTILCWCGKEKELSAGFAQTTNNRMELLGAIAGLEALKRPCRVRLTSDSKYLTDGMTRGWAESWRKKGWKKADNKPALNTDLWERLLDLCALHEVTFLWIKGHAGHPYNERCDALAVAAALEAQKKESAAEDAAKPTGAEETAKRSGTGEAAGGAEA